MVLAPRVTVMAFSLTPIETLSRGASISIVYRPSAWTRLRKVRSPPAASTSIAPSAAVPALTVMLARSKCRTWPIGLVAMALDGAAAVGVGTERSATQRASGTGGATAMMGSLVDPTAVRVVIIANAHVFGRTRMGFLHRAHA